MRSSNIHVTESIFSGPPARVTLVAFLFSVAVTASQMAMPFLVFNQLGRGAFLSGVFAGSQALGYTLAALISAPYVGRSRNGLAWGSVGIIGFMGLTCAMPMSRDPLVCGALFSGAFALSALAWPSFHSWMGAEPDPVRRARSMGRLNVGWSVGAGVGPFLAGPLYEVDYRLPYVFIGLVCLFALYVIRAVPHEQLYFGTGSVAVPGRRASHERASEAFLWCAWCATFTAHVCIGAVRSIFPKRLDDIIALGQLRLFHESDPVAWLNSATATRCSWLVFMLGMGTATLFLVLGRSGWWHHRFSVLVVAQLLTGLSMWSLGYTHSLALMLVAFAVIGGNLGVAFFSSVYYGTANPALKHGRSAINEGVVGAGGIVGGFGFAFAGARFGIDMPFMWMPVFIFGVILAQWLLIRVRRNAGMDQEAPFDAPLSV